MSDAAREKAEEIWETITYHRTLGVGYVADALDAFAAEQTAQKDAEIAALQEGVRRLEETCTCGAFMTVCRALLADPAVPR